MSELSVSGEDLLKWNDLTARKWRDFVTANPALLVVPCDIRDSATVGRALQHIVAVELRYAQRLAALPESDYADVKYGSGDEILATHDQAMALLRGVLADPAFDWGKEIEFVTITAGKLKASRKTLLVHALMHSIRHYAQLATLARQQGFKPDWQMDYLMMGATRV
jgi:uncharacterized damage-inducible protein DinB